MVAGELRVSGELIVGVDRNKHARLFSVFNLVSLLKLGIDLVLSVWSISRIAVIFNRGDDFESAIHLFTSEISLQRLQNQTVKY